MMKQQSIGNTTKKESLEDHQLRLTGCTLLNSFKADKMVERGQILQLKAQQTMKPARGDRASVLQCASTTPTSSVSSGRTPNEMEQAKLNIGVREFDEFMKDTEEHSDSENGCYGAGCLMGHNQRRNTIHLPQIDREKKRKIPALLTEQQSTEKKSGSFKRPPNISDSKVVRFETEPVGELFLGSNKLETSASQSDILQRQKKRIKNLLSLSHNKPALIFQPRFSSPTVRHASPTTVRKELFKRPASPAGKCFTEKKKSLLYQSMHSIGRQVTPISQRPQHPVSNQRQLIKLQSTKNDGSGLLLEDIALKTSTLFNNPSVK